MEESSQSVVGSWVDLFRTVLAVGLKDSSARPAWCSWRLRPPPEPASRCFRITCRASTCGRMQIGNLTIVMTAQLDGKIEEDCPHPAKRQSAAHGAAGRRAALLGCRLD